MAKSSTYAHRSAHKSLNARLRVFDMAAVTFTRARAAQAAASLAYYTFFSIFPLMLLFILGGSYFLSREDVLQRVTNAVEGVLPVSHQFVVQILLQVLQERTTVGVFVLASLLWSASGMFYNLAYEINMAWPEARHRNFLKSRLIGIDMIVALTGLLVLSIALDSLTKWLAGPNSASTPSSNWNPLPAVSSLGSWISVFLLYLAMYHWVPTVRVNWWASAWGAAAAAVGWKGATTGFALYLASPFARYQLVYGSLGAIVAFMFLIYIIALVTLYGAHLTAAIDHLEHKEHATSGAPGVDQQAASVTTPPKVEAAASSEVTPSKPGPSKQAATSNPKEGDQQDESGGGPQS